MTKKLKYDFITPIVILLFLAPISFPIGSLIIRSTVKRFNKISGLEKKRFEEKRQLAEDEKLYGVDFDKPISENFRRSSMSAKTLCISKGKESLNSLLNQDREYKEKHSQFSDVYKKIKKIKKDAYQNKRINNLQSTTSINEIHPLYDFIPSVYAKIENRFIQCVDQGSTGYGRKSLGLKIGEICEFMPQIQYTKTQLIPDKNSINDPNWNATVEKKYYLYDSFPYDCKI